MKILFLNRVYPPAEGATGRLLADLAAMLTKIGWQVTVVTASVPDARRSETIDGVRVERVAALPLGGDTLLGRALHFLSLYPALLARALRLPRADVVVTMTDPPLLALLGPILKSIKNSRLVHWSQDIYPEIAEELGVIPKKGWLAELCRAASIRALRRHDCIIAIGRCMKERFLLRGVAANSVCVIPNWAPEMHFIDHAENPFRREHALQDRFVVMYSGHLGRAYAFEPILIAAADLRSRHPEILFLFIGAGPRLTSLKRQAAMLPHVRFLLTQSAENLSSSLGAADLHLIPMRLELEGLVVPHKIYGILRAGRPVIFLGPRESEVARLIGEYRCGSVLETADGAVLAETIAAWIDCPERRRAAGHAARSAAEHFSAARAAEAFRKVLAGTSARD